MTFDKRLNDELLAALPSTPAMDVYRAIYKVYNAMPILAPLWGLVADAQVKAFIALTQNERDAVDDCARQAGYNIQRTK